MTKIYKIKQNNKVVYCGKTKQTLLERFKQHKKQKMFDDTYSIELIEEVEDGQAKTKEDFYIRLYNTRTEGLNKKFESTKPNTNYTIKTLIDAEAKALSIIKQLKKKRI